MELRRWSLSELGGRRVIVVLGGLYVVAALGWPFTPPGGERTLNEIVLISTLTIVPGLVLLYAGYRLPDTEIRPDLFGTIAKWCLGGIGVMLSILLLIAVAAEMADPVANVLILTALASVAGLGMGYNDAQAKSRARNADERRQEAERYSQQLERYETIVETVNDGIFVADEDNHFTLVNEAYAELVGYDREELLSSHTSLVVEADVESLSNEIQRDLEGGSNETNTYEGTLETASGETVEAEATVAQLPAQADTGHAFVGVVRDVTKRNEREHQLEQQNERLDSFARMIAHELRNPLMIGQMYCTELPEESAPQAVEYITESFDRIEDIIDVMLVVTQGYEAVSEQEPIDLAAVARNVWDSVDTLEATLEIQIESTIQADETYIKHLFRNLFENAVEHGGADVTVTVGELPTGFYIADNGTGISPDDRETVFKMGYTTAASHGGMGLGLTFVQELANIYEWTCGVAESAGGGAQFEFTGITDAHTLIE